MVEISLTMVGEKIFMVQSALYTPYKAITSAVTLSTPDPQKPLKSYRLKGKGRLSNLLRNLKTLRLYLKPNVGLSSIQPYHRNE